MSLLEVPFFISKSNNLIIIISAIFHNFIEIYNVWKLILMSLFLLLF